MRSSRTLLHLLNVIKLPSAHTTPGISQRKNFLAGLSATSVLIVSQCPYCLQSTETKGLSVQAAFLGHKSLQINIRCFSTQAYLPQKLLKKAKYSHNIPKNDKTLFGSCRVERKKTPVL